MTSVSPGRFRRVVFLALVGLASVASSPSEAAGRSADSALSSNSPAFMHVYLGTYTGGKSQGIYLSRLELETGRLEPARLVAKVASPSFLALHPSGRFLYAVNESDRFREEKNAGGVSAFALAPETGDLTFLNTQSSKGAHPCHLTVDGTGRWVLVANYSGGNLAVLPIDEKGFLGPAAQVVRHEGWSSNAQRQNEPHAHSINLDAANRVAVAADLGIDKLMIYDFDAATGRLTPSDSPAVRAAPGSGPRHFTFHPEGKRAFVINELSSTLTSLTYDPKKVQFTEAYTISTLPGGKPVPGNSTAEVQVHPSGKFVYGSNRGHDSIAVFKLERRGRLGWLENEPTQGKTPRNFGIDPTGRWLLAANQDSDSVVVFRIDSKTGMLEPTEHRIEVGKPVCVKFLACPK